jgi:hypothetical protein
LTLDNARARASFVALTARLNLVSEWLPDLPKEKLDAYLPHDPEPPAPQRPPGRDLFERDPPRIWHPTAGEGDHHLDLIGPQPGDRTPARRRSLCPR